MVDRRKAMLEADRRIVGNDLEKFENYSVVARKIADMRAVATTSLPTPADFDHADLEAIRLWPRDPWPAPLGARLDPAAMADELEGYRLLVMEAMRDFGGAYVDPFGNDYSPHQVTTPGDAVSRVKGLGVLVAAYVPHRPHAVEQRDGSFSMELMDYCYMTYSTRRSAMLAAAAHAEAAGWVDGRYPFDRIDGSSSLPPLAKIDLMQFAAPGRGRRGQRGDRKMELLTAREVRFPVLPSADRVTDAQVAATLKKGLDREEEFQSVFDHDPLEGTPTDERRKKAERKLRVAAKAAALKVKK